MLTKTLKTHLVEAVVNYLLSRDKNPHITVEWETLDKRKGSIENVTRDSSHVVLNLSAQATNNFNIENNAFIFNVRFGGINTQLVVPTAAIQFVYDLGTEEGMVFNPRLDLLTELAEFPLIETLEHISITKKPKLASHLTVVK
jgi:stringent starvation protein B